MQILFFSATYSKPILAFARTVVPRAYLVTPRSTEELVLDVIFQVRMDVNKCRGGKLQVRINRYVCFLCFTFSFWCVRFAALFFMWRDVCSIAWVIIISTLFVTTGVEGHL